MSFWTSLRDTVEAVGAVAGNYFLPGSGMLTGQLVSKGAQEDLNSGLGQAAMLASGVAGGMSGNTSNYGKIFDAAGNLISDSGAATGGAWNGTDFGGSGPSAFSASTPTGLAALPSDVAAAGGGVGSALGGAAGGSNWMMPAALTASGLLGATSAQRAAQIQAAAQMNANQLQYQMYKEQQALQAPWLQAGTNALTKLQSMADYKPFDMNTFSQDPSYAFRLSEGQKALERSAAARGGLLSGATGKALTNYGQQAASQEYQNAFNRYQTERQATLAPYLTLAGYGQQATGAASNAAGAYGTAAGAGLTNIGAAQAAGQMGVANAASGALNSYLGYQNNQNLANALTQSRSSAYGA